MAELIIVVVKDFNQELLGQEMQAAGLLGGGLLWAGFDKINRRVYSPSAIHGNTPGELRFKYEPELTEAQQVTLNGILAAHDSTQLSTGQTNKAQDEIDRQNFVDTFNDWNTLTNVQQLNRTRELFRVVARLVDSRTDL